MIRKCETCGWWLPLPSLQPIESGVCRNYDSKWFKEPSDADDTCELWEESEE